MPATRPAAARRLHTLAPRPRRARLAAALAAVLASSAALAAPAAAQQHAALPVAHGAAHATTLADATPHVAAHEASVPAGRRAVRFETVASAPDTVSMRDLARGVPLILQLVDAQGLAIAGPVEWRILSGDAAFTSADGHSDADGFVSATLGRRPWLLAKGGTVTLEATARARGDAGTERIRMSFVLVRN